MKNFGRIMLIIGTVIGSGFASGKEIAVFFSRFGVFSYIFILLAFFLFSLVFYWLLAFGERGIKRYSSSKILLCISVFVSMVFTSSMFAGTTTTIKTDHIFIDIFLVLCLLFTCFFVSKKGVGSLANINAILIPFAIVILIICLCSNIGESESFSNGNIFSGGLFALLYVIMNVSTSSIVVGEMGRKMKKKDRLIVAIFSSLILTILLGFINYVLLSNKGSLNLSMPLLELSSGWYHSMMRVVIFLGCLTTLLSLVFTTSESLRKLGVKTYLNPIISIILPFFISFFGFGNIVSILYPIVSALGITLLLPFTPKLPTRR